MAQGEVASKPDPKTGAAKPLTAVYEVIIPIDNPDLKLEPGPARLRQDRRRHVHPGMVAVAVVEQDVQLPALRLLTRQVAKASLSCGRLSHRPIPNLCLAAQPKRTIKTLGPSGTAESSLKSNLAVVPQVAARSGEMMDRTPSRYIRPMVAGFVLLGLTRPGRTEGPAGPTDNAPVRRFPLRAFRRWRRCRALPRYRPNRN